MHGHTMLYLKDEIAYFPLISIATLKGTHTVLQYFDWMTIATRVDILVEAFIDWQRIKFLL